MFVVSCKLLKRNIVVSRRLDGRVGHLRAFRLTSAAAPAAGAPAPTPATAPKATGNAVFPTAISPKYSSESAGKARMHTCLDQYNANKATNANGGLKWIQKGGGYYSECNKQLKG